MIRPSAALSAAIAPVAPASTSQPLSQTGGTPNAWSIATCHARDPSDACSATTVSFSTTKMRPFPVVGGIVGAAVTVQVWVPVCRS